jgi:hypothetical protein
MCSIIASYEKEVLNKLIDLNQSRGSFSYSYNELKDKLETTKDFGTFNKEKINDNDFYKIGHVQAPTGGLIKDKNRIHPTEYKKTYLFHNGLITPRGINKLKEEINESIDFDTYLLHKAINEKGFEYLSTIEGLFACLYIKDNNIYIFRTKHGKLYIDKDCNISSERFENSKCINSDTIYQINIKEKNIKEISYFKTKRANYIINGEM